MPAARLSPGAMLDRVAERLDRHDAFSCETDTYTYGDVVRAARLRDEGSVTEALAEDEAVPRALEDGLDSSQLRAGVVAFRRVRGLLSAQDYRAWLTARNVDTAAVEAHVRGVTPDTAERLHDELILSGTLGNWARSLADAVAVATATAPATTGIASATTGSVAPGNRTDRLAAILSQQERVLADLLVPAAIDRVIAEHRHEWERLDWTELALDFEGAAREAALWMRADGFELTDVAGLAHAESRTHSARHCDVPPALSPLLAAGTGQLIGPLPTDEGWWLARLGARTPARAEDLELRARAREHLIDHALERHRAGRIRWHVEY